MFLLYSSKNSVYFKNVEIDLHVYDLVEKGIRHYSNLGLVSIMGDLNARTGSMTDEPIDCNGIEKYVHSLEGVDLNEQDTVSVGRCFSMDKKVTLLVSGY